MPRVNITPRYLAPPSGSRLSALLYGELKLSGKRCVDLQGRLGCSAPYLRKMLRHPERCPMDDVRRLAVLLGIRKTEFCNAWGW